MRRFRTTPRFLRHAGAISRQLEGTRGLLGFTFRAKILSRKFYTLSVWEDEQALEDFIRSKPHVDTMPVMRPHMAEPKFVRWSVKGSEIPPSWDRAMAVLRAG